MNDCEITFLIGDLNFRLDFTQEDIKTILYDVKKRFSKESLKMGLGNGQNNEALADCLKTLWEKDELLAYQKDPNDFLSKFI